jgi:hypothetical protein
MASSFRFRVAFTAGMAFAVLTNLPSLSLGNVYPTNLDQSADTFNPSAAESVVLSYLLNEDATNVSIDILDNTNSVVRTLSGLPLTKGTQTAVWDGKDNSNVTLPDGDYSFRVTSTGVSRSGWEQISTNSTLNNFELPRGVAVNRNPDSPYYGRVYVSNGRALPTAAGRTMADGIYMLNADFTDTGIAGGTGPHAGGVDWTLDGTSAASPFKLEVTSDGSLYITGWSDGQSGLWQADANMVTATEALDNTGRNAGGLNTTHGSISDVVVVGSGASRQIYSADEDLAPVRSIHRYDIGTTTTFTGPPSAVFFDNAANGGKVINSFNSLARDEDGNFWYSQNRFNGTDQSSLFQLDGTTGAILWESLPNLGSPDPLRGIQAISYDPVNNVLALVTNISNATNIIIFDPASKTVISQFGFAESGALTTTDVNFDNAGNMYITNRSAERIHVWSPPSAPQPGFVANEFITSSLGPLGTLSISSVDPGLDGDYNDDGMVDAADYVAWRKTPADFGGAGGYDTWRENFGRSNEGSGGNSQVPEPSAFFLSAIVAFAGSSCCRRRSQR